MINVFDITEFGAVGDGVTDCTAAIQAALDAAGEVRGAVIVPPGNYRCKDLQMRRETTIRGFDAWGFRRNNASLLTLADGDARCGLTLTCAVGAVVRDLGIEGGKLGKNVHGVMIDHPIYDAAGEEDTPTIENCRIHAFSGSAVYFNHVWCSTIRNNMLSHSYNGLYQDGWDAFISGNWFSGNENCGVEGGDMFSSTVFYGNRIEWNMGGGLHMRNSKFTSISCNQFDRSGGPQLKIYSKDADRYNRNITVTGNTFNRSGSGIFRSELQAPGYENCHFFAEECVNLVFTGNTLHAGRDGMDDSGKRHYGPDYGLVLRHLRASLIKDNVMQGASVKQNVVDLGEHEEEVYIKDNIGGVMESEERWTAMLADKPVENVKTYFSLTPEERKAMGLPESF
ncbi:MAG: right-handed parallel beta-helix repeat-containing protein [Clostridia bacterium]|nr:right-handed parallel beta-helix repeat-containing protein [Clostridia bacterium]